MKNKVIFVFILLVIFSSAVFCSDEEMNVKKCITNYWTNVFSENPGKAINQFSIHTYFNLVFGKEFKDISPEMMKKLITNGSRMYGFNMKNLSESLKSKGYTGKINIHEVKISGIGALASGTIEGKDPSGSFTFKQYLRKINGKWLICDVAFENKKDSRLMAELISKIGIEAFSSLLNTYFRNEKYVELKNDFISVNVPESFEPIQIDQAGEHGRIITAVARENTCITISLKENCGFKNVNESSAAIKENLQNSGASFIAEKYVENPDAYFLKVVVRNEAMPTGFAFLTIHQQIKGNNLYTVLIISPDLWSMQLIAHQAEKILNSLKLK